MPYRRMGRHESAGGATGTIKERYPKWADSGATSLVLRHPDMRAVETMAEVARLNTRG